jgi:hypothetical protein
MVLVDLTQHLTMGSIDVTLWNDFSQAWFWHSPLDNSILAQHFDTDVFKGGRGLINNFVKSGQAWALLIGVILGYVLRGLTSYG